MKANELRIGNWVEHNSDWCYRGEDVYQFQWDTSDWFALGECTLFLENIEPIPLTEEWLIRFGFEKKKVTMAGKECFGWINFSFYLDIWDNHNGFIYCYMGGNTHVKYVHQLQNLYFALTGEELTLKK